MPRGVVDCVVRGVEREEAHDAAFVGELSGDDGAGDGAGTGAEGFAAFKPDACAFAGGGDGGGGVSIPDTEEAAFVEVLFGCRGVAELRDQHEGIDVTFIEAAGRKIERAYIAESIESLSVCAGSNAPLVQKRRVEQAFGAQLGKGGGGK